MQTRKDDNAFPVFDKDGLVLAKDDQYSWEGLSKREYFASAAMNALIIQNKYLGHSVPIKAVQMADELIKALNEQHEN